MTLITTFTFIAERHTCMSCHVCHSKGVMIPLVMVLIDLCLGDVESLDHNNMY